MPNLKIDSTSKINNMYHLAHLSWFHEVIELRIMGMSLVGGLFDVTLFKVLQLICENIIKIYHDNVLTRRPSTNLLSIFGVTRCILTKA